MKAQDELVLGLMNEEAGCTCTFLVDLVHAALPCAYCAGTGIAAHEADAGMTMRHGYAGCKRCWGWGYKPFSYHDCWVILTRLHKAGLVTRRKIRDEFGEESHGVVWERVPLAAPVADDPLEQLYLAPAAQR